jgi:tetratricopeptide (TPR) repeat protein
MDLPTSEPTLEVQQQVAKANFLRARSLFEQEDYFPAYEMVKQSVEYDPNRAEYWILLSRIQRKNPKWVRQAAETMRRAAEKMPDNAEVWFELSEACAAERNEPERVSSLKQVLRIDPVNRRAQATLKEIAALKPGH